jgi:hypothetical protein
MAGAALAGRKLQHPPVDALGFLEPSGAPQEGGEIQPQPRIGRFELDAAPQELLALGAVATAGAYQPEQVQRRGVVGVRGEHRTAGMLRLRELAALERSGCLGELSVELGGREHAATLMHARDA